MWSNRDVVIPRPRLEHHGGFTRVRVSILPFDSSLLIFLCLSCWPFLQAVRIQGRPCPPGVTWPCPETCLVVTIEGGCHWDPAVDRDAAKHPAMHTAAPHWRITRPKCQQCQGGETLWYMHMHAACMMCTRTYTRRQTLMQARNGDKIAHMVSYPAFCTEGELVACCGLERLCHVLSGYQLPPVECRVRGPVLTAFPGVNSSSPCNSSMRRTLILQLKDPRHRDVKQLSQSHAARKWPNWP